jgi:hypothetical protein
MKTHSCHVLLQRIIPAGLRGLVHHDVYEAVAQLRRNLRTAVVQRLKNDIPLILRKLEKIFPPTFFDVMVHLAIHLPDEALLRGPVQYGWMYQIEWRLGTLKNLVRNRARSEGSIAKAYIESEVLAFCSMYRWCWHRSQIWWAIRRWHLCFHAWCLTYWQGSGAMHPWKNLGQTSLVCTK